MSNERGFTLVEMLVTFSVLLVILSLISPFLRVVYQNTSTKEFNKLEWEIFIQQAKMEIREATQVTISNQNQTVSFNNPEGDIVSYEIFYDKIRRRVNGAGNEILLQKISALSFLAINNGWILSITTVDGDNYRAMITGFVPVEVTEI
ncbi:competence type IV pilus minor pilin ComGF [Fredinandcohnia humi]